MKPTIVISGAKGFLASHLITLLKEEYTLFGIGKQADNDNGIAIFSSEEIDEIAIQPDFVILCHAAVSSGNHVVSSEELAKVNVELTKRLVQKFKDSKIIYISTASVYDVNNGIIKENSPIRPQSDYAASKLQGEEIVAHTQNAVIIRFPSLFGKGMKENTIIPNYVNQALQNGTIEIWGNGERKQNYISIENACNYIVQTIENYEKVKNKILLAVSKIEYSNSDLAQIIASATKAEMKFVHQDHSTSWHYNNDRTCELLGWEPHSDFATDIQNYIQWKRKQS